MKKALIVVDVQNDFCKGGSLEVRGAEEILPYVNTLINSGDYAELIFTQDFHPQGHLSFASSHQKKVGEEIDLGGVRQVLWADHCVQGTQGAEFHAELFSDGATHIVQKGLDKSVDSYSAFFDNQKIHSTGLADYLREKGIEQVEVVGLALDYCVKYTCLDAVSLGFKTALHLRGTKAVNLHPNDEKNTIFELLKKGVSVLG